MHERYISINLKSFLSHSEHNLKLLSFQTFLHFLEVLALHGSPISGFGAIDEAYEPTIVMKQCSVTDRGPRDYLVSLLDIFSKSVPIRNFKKW